MSAPQESFDSRSDGGMFAQQIDSIVPMPSDGTQNYRAEITIGDTDSPASGADPGDAGGLFAVQRGSSVEMPNPSQQNFGDENI